MKDVEQNTDSRPNAKARQEARLAAAMRDNLRKRKAQERGRSEATIGEQAECP
ncbi:MAG: hypothetical protein WDO70_06180 [Alphaproteobacteria bacterium]